VLLWDSSPPRSPLTNLVRESIRMSELAALHCLHAVLPAEAVRRAHTRGMIASISSKVELVSITTLTERRRARRMLSSRGVRAGSLHIACELSTGDMACGAQDLDIEVWLPGRDVCEISSCSNCGTSRRAHAGASRKRSRLRPHPQRLRVAVAALIAVMETYQERTLDRGATRCCRTWAA